MTSSVSVKCRLDAVDDDMEEQEEAAIPLSLLRTLVSFRMDDDLCRDAEEQVCVCVCARAYVCV